MRLIYFDETKFSKDNPYFFIGGILLEEKHISNLESTLMQIQDKFFGKSNLGKDTELHGEHIYNGKGLYKKRTLVERIGLFGSVGQFLIKNKIPIRIMRINIDAHKQQYERSVPEYQFGLMFILERFCYFLDKVNDIGIVFGDYEKDEITRSIRDFSRYKNEGTPNPFGPSLQRLKDTIYFTHSHHSRFIQVADMVMYMANRYETEHKPQTWHDVELSKIWTDIKGKTNFEMGKCVIMPRKKERPASEEEITERSDHTGH